MTLAWALFVLFGCARDPLVSTAEAQEPRAVSTCEGCHEEIAAEHASTLHRTSFTDAVFEAAYRAEPHAFCRNCHAPRAQAEGIGCESCHQAPRCDGSGRSTPVACETCHEFHFPDETQITRPIFDARELMQSTAAEHEASAHASTPCVDCHMPVREGHRTHRLLGLGSRELLAQAVTVAVRARPVDSEICIEIEIGPDRIGHGFPTGDLYRLAELTVGEAPHARRFRMTRSFAERLVDEGDDQFTLSHGEVDDTRVGPRGDGPPRPWIRHLRVPRSTRQIPWTLDHYRMPESEARDIGLPFESLRTAIAEGSVSMDDALARASEMHAGCEER